MGKRSKQRMENGVLKGAASESCVLLLMNGLLAFMLHKGTIGCERLRLGLILLCVVAGTAGVLWGPKGEGSIKRRLLACGIPAAFVLLAGILLAKEVGEVLQGATHAACLLLPCLVSLFLERKPRRRGATRKKHSFAALRR